MKLGPVIEPLLVIAATVLGCAGLYEYVIRRNRLLSVLSGISGIQSTPGHRAATKHSDPELELSSDDRSAGY
jgi:hypothetical protein